MATLTAKSGGKRRLKVIHGEAKVVRRVNEGNANADAGTRPRRLVDGADPSKSAAGTDSSWTECLLEDIEKSSHRRKQQLQRMPPVVEGWEISGTVLGAQQEIFHGGFYDWSMRDDGTLAFAAGCSRGRGLAAAFTAASLLAAFRSHVYYRHTVSEMLSRLNQTLWMDSAGDQFADLFYGVVCPETGRFELGGAGDLEILRIGKDGQCWNSYKANETLGLDPETTHAEQRSAVAMGEQIVIMVSNEAIPDRSKQAVSDALKKHGKNSLRRLPDCIDQELNLTRSSGPRATISLLLVRRCHP